MPGPIPVNAQGQIKLPPKPLLITKLSKLALQLVEEGYDPGLLAFCGSFPQAAPDPVDKNLATIEGDLVQVQTVEPYHGWTADIQPGVDVLVLVWPREKPTTWAILGYLPNDGTRAFPIPHHVFRPFQQQQPPKAGPTDERRRPHNHLAPAEPHVVRP